MTRFGTESPVARGVAQPDVVAIRSGVAKQPVGAAERDLAAVRASARCVYLRDPACVRLTAFSPRELPREVKDGSHPPSPRHPSLLSFLFSLIFSVIFFSLIHSSKTRTCFSERV